MLCFVRCADYRLLFVSDVPPPPEVALPPCFQCKTVAGVLVNGIVPVSLSPGDDVAYVYLRVRQRRPYEYFTSYGTSIASRIWHIQKISLTEVFQSAVQPILISQALRSPGEVDKRSPLTRRADDGSIPLLTPDPRTRQAATRQRNFIDALVTENSAQSIPVRPTDVQINTWKSPQCLFVQGDNVPVQLKHCG